jgi:hypothetical protein
MVANRLRQRATELSGVVASPQRAIHRVANGAGARQVADTLSVLSDHFAVRLNEHGASIDP